MYWRRGLRPAAAAAASGGKQQLQQRRPAAVCGGGLLWRPAESSGVRRVVTGDGLPAAAGVSCNCSWCGGGSNVNDTRPGALDYY